MTSYKVFDEPVEPTVKEGEKWVANKQRASDGELQPGNLPASVNKRGPYGGGRAADGEWSWAEQFHKTLDNTEVFFAIVNALGLDARQGKFPFVAER